MKTMQKNNAKRRMSSSVYAQMYWLFCVVVGKIYLNKLVEFLRVGSIDEREKNLLASEAKRLCRFGLRHDEIYEQLTMVNRNFFIQPLPDKEVLSICVKAYRG